MRIKMKAAIYFLLLIAPANVWASGLEPKEDTFTFATAGDMDANLHTISSLESLKKSEADFFIAVGDLSYDRIKPESAWCEFIKSHLGSEMPVLLLSGNHESDGEDGLIDNFVRGFPDPLGVHGVYGKEYFFDYPKNQPIARFVAVSPDLNFTHGGRFTYEKGSKRYLWLSQTVDDARRNGITWIFVFMHKNCISAGNKTCEIGTDIMNLLIEKKVDVIVQGHDHTYQRSFQLGLSQGCQELAVNAFNAACVRTARNKDLYSKGQGPVLLVSGAFGAGLYNINATDTERPYFAEAYGANQTPMYGYSFFEVSRARVHGSFVSPDSQARVADEFEILSEK